MRKHCVRFSGNEKKWKYVYTLPIGEDYNAGRDWGRRRRGRPRMRWLDGIMDSMDGITDSMDVSLSELRGLVMDREAWHAAIHGAQRVGHD